MMSITKHSDYAIVMLAHFSKHPSSLISAKEVSQSLKLPYPTVSKLLKILVKSKLLASIQGSRGGYRLDRPSASISVASVIEAVEGPIAMTECTSGDHGKCQTESWCSVKPHWALINGVIKKSLEDLPLSALNQPPSFKLREDQDDKIWKSLFPLSKEAS
jgi:FeS assembly SUF system regulator